MTIGEGGGEFALIERLAARFGTPTGGLRVGAGDDAALLGATEVGQQTVVTTDLLLEDIHFRRRWCDPFSLGVKAAAVNLSDIAAMGAIPTFAFISLAVPAATTVAWVEELYRGLGETLARYGAQIAGGDTNVSPQGVVVNVTLLGKVTAGKAVLRRGAHPGDVLLVTGPLGNAAAGLALLEAKGRDDAERLSPEAVEAQLRPVPRLATGQWLAGRATAMMDLSDGLLADTAKLCRASGVRAVVDPQRVPVGAAAQTVAALRGTRAEDGALQGGEDYELLFTLPGPDAARIVEALERDTGTRAVVIGEIAAGEGVTLAGEGVSAEKGGWDHFHGV